MLAGVLVANGEALEDLGEEGGRPVAGCQRVASGVTGDASDLVVVPHIQGVVLLEVNLYREVRRSVHNNVKIRHR